MPAEQSAEQQAAMELVRLARERGLALTGPDELLKQLTKSVIESALSEELTEHLGYEKRDPAGVGSGNSRITDKVIEEMQDWQVRLLDERRFLGSSTLSGVA